MAHNVDNATLTSRKLHHSTGRDPARVGLPYSGHVGHEPDTAISGAAEPPSGWIDMPGVSHQVVSGVLGSCVGQTISRFTIDGKIPKKGRALSTMFINGSQILQAMLLRA